MLKVVTFKWGDAFTSEQVNTLARMVERHYGPHEFICITDDPRGLEVPWLPLWSDYADLKSPHHGYPSCYRRLKVFAPEMEKIIGPRFVVLDIDVVITGDLRPLFDRTEDLVLLKNPNPNTQYNGGLWLMDAGCRPKVWTNFSEISPHQTFNARLGGSDQAWLSFVLKDEATFEQKDGVYFFRQDDLQSKGLPKGARFVSFNGETKPWHKDMQSIDWIREHYR